MATRALTLLLLAGCGDTAITPDAAPPAGLVSWFSFDDCCNDKVGSAIMVYGGPFNEAITPDGHAGKGFYLNGTNQRGLIDTTNTPLSFTGPFSISAWVRLARVPDDYAVVASRSYGAGDETSFTLAIDSTLHVRYDTVVSTNTVSPSEWTHVALSFDGTTKRIYIDDVLAGSGPGTAPMWDDHKYINIGADEGAEVTTASHYFQGIMDDVMFFDRAR